MIESVKKTALNIAILSILELWVLFCIIYIILFRWLYAVKPFTQNKQPFLVQCWSKKA